MSLSITIAGVAIAFDEGSWKLSQLLDQSWRCQFTVLDYAGTAVFAYKSVVIVTDDGLGRLYEGYVIDDKLDKSNTYPDPTIEHQIDTTDNISLADNRTSNRLYTTPQYAGKIAVDMVSDVLSQEGVTANYALSYTTTQADWAEGTLANTVATPNVDDGDLELLGSSSAAASYITQAQWNTGTKSNVTVNAGGDVDLTNSTRNWDNGVFSSQSLYGNGNPSDKVLSGQYQLHCDASSEVRSYQDYAGTWANFTLTFDVYLGANTFKYGGTYRTTNKTNGDGSYAYAIEMDNAGIHLRVGSNGGSNSSSEIGSTNFSPQLATGQMYTIKAVVNGSSHSIYVNGTLYISVTDSTYTAAGYFALRNRNNYSGGGTWDIFDNFGVIPVTSGTWTSPSTSVNAVSVVAASLIKWDTSLSTGGTVLVQTSVNGGSTYSTCANGGAIPGLLKGGSGTGKSLLVKVTLSTTNPTLIPDIRNLTWSVTGGYVASGTRSTVPLGNDLMIRANQSGWGTAFDGQTWTKTGAGTDAIASNEATITNTTGDVHEKLGSTSWADEEATVRLQISASTMQAGIELRYVDSNNFYRLAASTTAVSIYKSVSGILATVATVAVTLTINSWYRLRFRIVGVPGTGPASLYGKLWADLTLEPGDVNGILSTIAPAWTVQGVD